MKNNYADCWTRQSPDIFSALESVTDGLEDPLPHSAPAYRLSETEADRVRRSVRKYVRFLSETSEDFSDEHPEQRKRKSSAEWQSFLNPQSVSEEGQQDPCG